MFRRRKILLALLEQFGGELSRIRMQKLLFLYCKENGDPIYGFVPHKYGCFSFQAAAEQQKLITKGLLKETEIWQLNGETDYIGALGYEERKALWKLQKRFGDVSQPDLVRYVYKNYPYFALRSEIAGEHLSAQELKIINERRPSMRGNAICSLGYEGLLLEDYLNKLILKDVRLVCDVRKRPLSRKFGFSRTALRNSLEQMGIEYRNFPELGIESSKRRELNTQSDYDALFSDYEKTTLKTEQDAVNSISSLLAEKERIALLCYERLPEQCHRTRVLRAVLDQFRSDCPVYTE